MLDHALEEFREGGTRAEQMKQTEKELFELYKNTELHTKPEQLSKEEEPITVTQPANASGQFTQIRRSIW